MIQDILFQKTYVLKNTISKSDNNRQILAPNDYNKQHFLCSNFMSWPGLCKSDNIKQMITLTRITLSGAYCIGIIMQLLDQWWQYRSKIQKASFAISGAYNMCENKLYW